MKIVTKDLIDQGLLLQVQYFQRQREFSPSAPVLFPKIINSRTF